MKVFEAKVSPSASPSLPKFSVSLGMRNRYHGTNLSTRHRERNVIACRRNINQQLSNHSYLHPLHFGCFSFIIWSYINVKCIISYGALSVTAQSHDYMVQGNFFPPSKSIFSIFLITTSYIKKIKRKVLVFLCGSRVPKYSI